MKQREEMVSSSSFHVACAGRRAGAVEVGIWRKSRGFVPRHI
jgi:hypothetical protein